MGLKGNKLGLTYLIFQSPFPDDITTFFDITILWLGLSRFHLNKKRFILISKKVGLKSISSFACNNNLIILYIT